MSLKFAPLDIPLERRAQTSAIILYVFLIAFGGSFVLLLSVYILLYTEYLRWLYIAYLTWIFCYDYNKSDEGSRPWKWTKNWVWWKYIALYFPIKLIKSSSGELDPKKNYLFCCFPHGIIGTGAFTAILTEACGFSKLFPNHTSHLHTLKTNFYLPILRELFLFLGAVSASAASLNYLMGKPEGGNISALVIGGAQEAYYTRPKHYKLVLKNRKGFVKIALKNGSPLVPVMSFGEPDIMGQVKFKEGSFFSKCQLLVKRYFGFVPLVPAGRGIFQYNYGILPIRKEINVVVGEPIEVEKVEDPSQKQIDDLHEKFIEKLISLFESEKKKYLKNCEDIHIQLV